MSRHWAAVLALALTPAAAVAQPPAMDREALHKAMQGRWQADKRKVAESDPEWKTRSAEQRKLLLELMPEMSFEFTATRLTLLAEGGDEARHFDYKVVGAKDRTLRLRGRAPDETQDEEINVEVVDEHTLRMTRDSDQTVFWLQRVKPASPPPSPR